MLCVAFLLFFPYSSSYFFCSYSLLALLILILTLLLFIAAPFDRLRMAIDFSSARCFLSLHYLTHAFFLYQAFAVLHIAIAIIIAMAVFAQAIAFGTIIDNRYVL